MRLKQFGGKLSQKQRSVYEKSVNWRDGRFQNLVKTETVGNWREMPGILLRQIKGHAEGEPKKDLPILPLDKKAFLSDDEPKFVWYGHSVFLLRLNGKTILIDPMLGSDASPIAPTKTKRFSKDSLKCIDELPEIDLMLMSHDHYDHLDYASIKKLREKTKKYYVALGVKRHLVAWGIDKKNIREFDWWDADTFADIGITFTPTRHLSGRSLSSINRCLWGGWALKTDKHKIWFSGDGGYGDHFKEVGKKLGPFDIGFMECGQYNDDWPNIHMFPSESVQAGLDALAKVLVPVHWGGFNLSYQHSWYEPVENFIEISKKQSQPYITPKMGEVFVLTSKSDCWWRQYV